ncbi:hypothetical protein HYPSUDRAFT_60099 [Hypholoma sublateritium FD-334 SS-4]|uniref:Uncharacterized protein n=1 Tax=Hypholoma sublateritium (strain FD-334 SS-4) TaxID=945553 RepID=A0A0D2KF29_HYPSF|nr:hypothetical protein HYPSUDRAFT_60099 [Hypholoma sublateritium FD-334 SS-4]
MLRHVKDELQRQIRFCLEHHPDIEYEIRKQLGNSSGNQPCLDTLAYSGPRNLTIAKCNNSTYEIPFPFPLLISGYSTGDFMFLGTPEEELTDEDQTEQSDSEDSESSDDGPQGEGDENLNHQEPEEGHVESSDIDSTKRDSEEEDDGGSESEDNVKHEPQVKKGEPSDCDMKSVGSGHSVQDNWKPRRPRRRLRIQRNESSCDTSGSDAEQDEPPRKKKRGQTD